MTLGIVKRSEDEFAEWLGTEWGFVEGLLSYDDEPIRLGNSHYLVMGMILLLLSN